MSEAKPTPGNWLADDNEGFGTWGIWSNMSPTGSGTAGAYIAKVFGDSAEAEANARIFAAGKDMLAAAKSALNFISNTEGELGIALESGDLLRAAIFKAEGKL